MGIIRKKGQRHEDERGHGKSCDTGLFSTSRWVLGSSGRPSALDRHHRRVESTALGPGNRASGTCFFSS